MVLRLYPGVSPTSVYDLEHLTWAYMALAIDQYLTEQKRRALASRGAAASPRIARRR